MGLRAKPVPYTLVPALLVAGGLAWVCHEYVRDDWLISWVAGITLATLPVWWLDKRRAAKGKFRVPEATLHLLSVAGGPLAALVGMQFLRHKTRHVWFWVLNVALLVLWGGGVFFWLSRP